MLTYADVCRCWRLAEWCARKHSTITKASLFLTPFLATLMCQGISERPTKRCVFILSLPLSLSLSLSLSVCYIYIYTYIYTYIHTYIQTCIHASRNSDVPRNIRTSHEEVCFFLLFLTYLYTYIYIYNIYIYIYTHTHTHKLYIREKNATLTPLAQYGAMRCVCVCVCV